MNDSSPSSNPHAPIAADALIVGAGPAGLFLAFELGLLGVKSHIVDSLEFPGGQTAALYGDKPIYDIPAIAVCSGQELTDRLLAQLRPFAPTLHLSQEVRTLALREDGRWDVGTSAGTGFAARTVFIAAGVGAFTPRQLKLNGIDALEGTQVFHRMPPNNTLAGLHVVVAGGDESALDRIDALLASASPPASLTLVHRRAVLQAPAERLARFEALCAQGRVAFCVGQPTGMQREAGRLVALALTGPDGEMPALRVDALVVALGMSPRLGPLADWGLTLERKQVPVDPATFITTLPGIFAVGDIVHYPGKKKLILSAFHEATLAAFAAADLLDPARSRLLQYTTSSSELQRRLGVLPSV